MGRNEIERSIRNALAILTKQDTSAIALDRNLEEAIGLDSLGRLELLSEIEEQFDVFFTDVETGDASTIKSMIDKVEAVLSQVERVG